MAGRRKLQIQKVQIKLFDRIILLAVCIFIKKLTRIPQPLQAGDELCRVLP